MFTQAALLVLLEILVHWILYAQVEDCVLVRQRLHEELGVLQQPVVTRGRPDHEDALDLVGSVLVVAVEHAPDQLALQVRALDDLVHEHEQVGQLVDVGHDLQQVHLRVGVHEPQHDTLVLEVTIEQVLVEACLVDSFLLLEPQLLDVELVLLQVLVVYEGKHELLEVLCALREGECDPLAKVLLDIEACPERLGGLLLTVGPDPLQDVLLEQFVLEDRCALLAVVPFTLVLDVVAVFFSLVLMGFALVVLLKDVVLKE